MAVYQTEYSKLELSNSVIKFLLDEKCKLSEIYRNMCDVCREAYFCKKNTIELNMGLP